MYTDIRLLRVPELDAGHNHSFTFENVDTQASFFISRTDRIIENVNYHRKDRNLRVNYHCDEMVYVNYVMINNDKPRAKWYYYFVMDKIYINEKCTELILKLDVIQTYWFEMEFFSSFVEQQHYGRYAASGCPANYYFKQDLPMPNAEHVCVSVAKLRDYANSGTYIITTSDPIGKIGLEPSIADGGSNGSSASDVLEPFGTISASILRFLKFTEGYVPKEYHDSGGVLTIGYGVTQSFPDAYADLNSSCTERKASEYLYEIMMYFYNGIITDIINNRKNPLQNEIDAFVSLAYNCGVSGCKNSPMYKAYINNETNIKCASEWTSYMIYDGAGNPVLVDRRTMERDIFLYCNYKLDPITNWGTLTYITDNSGHGYIPSNLEWVKKPSLPPMPSNPDAPGSSSLRGKVVQSAAKLIGLPYVYGGNYPPLNQKFGGQNHGTDCSGLCQWAYNDAGYNVDLAGRWTTYTMYGKGVKIDISDAQPGDVVFTNFSSPSRPEHVRLIKSISGNTITYIGAENEDIGIIEGTMTYNNSSHKIATFP